MAVSSDRNWSDPRNWLLPLFAAVCVLAVTAVFANSLRQREHHHLQHLTEMAASAVKADIEADMESRVLAPMRTSKLWSLPANVPRGEWNDKAGAFLAEHPQIFAVAWVTPDGRTWSVPPNFADLLSSDLNANDDGRSKLTREPRFTSGFTDGQGDRFRRVLLPLPAQEGKAGYGLAALREHAMLEDLLGDVTTLGYGFELSESGQEVFRFDPSKDIATGAKSVAAEVTLPGMHWTLYAWPTATVIADRRSLLSTVTIIMGVVFSILTAIIIYFAQSVRRKNFNLTNEIGERQRYENALQASQARLNGIVETSADGIVAVDEQQRIMLFNKGAESIFGYKAEEVLGEPLDLLIPSRFHQSHRESVSAFGHDGSGPRRMAGPREVYGRGKNGDEFPIEASISRVVTPEGVTYTSIVRDVTERVRARAALVRAHEELERRVQERTLELAQANEWLRHEIDERLQTESRLRNSEQRLQGILDNCTACVFMKDIEGRYVLINRWYETLFSLKNEQTIGKTDADIFPTAVAAELQENDRLVLRSQHPIEFEEKVTHPDGTTHTYIATKFLVRDQYGAPSAICGIATDITRQKQAEALLSELSGGLMALQDEERKRLSRDLHEGTAQMLAAVQMNLEVAKKLAREDTQKVINALDVSLDLVDQSATQLRTMAYLLHPPGLDDFGLAAALRWYAEGFSSRSGIKVTVSIDTVDQRFDRDIEMAMFRIVQESLTNILRHSGSKTADIRLQQHESELELEVADRGSGVTPELMRRLSSGKTVPGIGIAGIRERVRQLSGVFGIQSGEDGVRLIAKLPTDRRKAVSVASSALTKATSN